MGGLLLCEFLGTGLLVGIGLSIVILFFGAGSALCAVLPRAAVRRVLAGGLFGATGGLIAVSPLGKISGAHINPVVTVAFLLKGRIAAAHAAGYVLAQLLGGAAGALPLLAWGPLGTSIHFGATVPGTGYGVWAALAGETVTTLVMVVLLFGFIGHRRLRRYTPLLFPVLYAVMVWLEAPISGTSTNPARSLGPALISSTWRDFWVYCLGPLLGSVLAVGLHPARWIAGHHIEVAKLYHFHHDPTGVLHGRVQRPESS